MDKIDGCVLRGGGWSSGRVLATTVADMRSIAALDHEVIFRHTDEWYIETNKSLWRLTLIQTVLIRTGDWFIQFQMCKSVMTKFNQSCDVKYAINVTLCYGWKVKYQDETQDLTERMKIQRQHIRQPKIRTNQVSTHIDNCNSILDFTIFKMEHQMLSLKVKRKQTNQIF